MTTVYTEQLQHAPHKYIQIHRKQSGTSSTGRNMAGLAAAIPIPMWHGATITKIMPTLSVLVVKLQTVSHQSDYNCNNRYSDHSVNRLKTDT